MTGSSPRDGHGEAEDLVECTTRLWRGYGRQRLVETGLRRKRRLHDAIQVKLDSSRDTPTEIMVSPISVGSSDRDAMTNQDLLETRVHDKST